MSIDRNSTVTAAHGTDDVEATLDATGAPASSGPSLQPGAAVGRYRLIDCVGRGATGSVWAAYDPELDRRVALKLLHDAPRTDVLLAEARSLAKLSHPNVIAVFDLGRAGERSFVAMEFVVGRTLRQWVHDAEPDAAAVIAAFVDAGRGLAAAHAAGIVHRDFKPENVMVGDDGRVRVGDFGLARPLHATSLEAAPSEDGGDIVATRQAGTPAYMAPELFMGRPADARSDEFAFCVALWEALFGRRPFDGTTVPELVSAVCQTVPVPPPQEGIPDGVVAALRRGLDGDPNQRFADMHALLVALAPSRRARPWRSIAAASLGAGTLALLAWGRAQAPTCDTEWPAWSTASRNAIDVAMRSVDVDGAAAIAEDATADLEAFAEGYRRLRSEVCILRDADPLRAAEAEACVLRLRHNADAVIDVLQRADREVLLASASLRASLGDPNGCLERRTPGAATPADPLSLARAEPIRAALAEAAVLLRAGQHEAAEATLDEAALAVESLGTPSMHSEVALVRGLLADDHGEVDRAREAFYDAVSWATRAGDRRASASAWIELIYCEGYVHNDAEAAAVATRQSEAELAALGGDDELELRRSTRMIPAYFAEGRLEEASALATRVAAEYREAHRDLDAAAVLMNQVNIDMALVRHDGAKAAIDEVERIWQAELPREHPWFARVASARSSVAENLGDRAAALRYAEQAYEISRASLGDDHVDTCARLSRWIELVDEDHARALALSERLLDHARHHAHATTRLNALLVRATALLRAGRATEADGLMREADTAVEAALAPDAPGRIDFYATRAEVARAVGRKQDVVADLERALTIDAATWGDEHINHARTELALATALREAGRVDDAKALLARVIASIDGHRDAPALVRLAVLVDLAIELYACDERESAREQARRARALVTAEDLSDTESARALDAHPVGAQGSG